MSIEIKALEFATKCHAGQVRKYTGEAYITHPIAVAEIVREVPHTPKMIAAALLHDVREDCGVTSLQLHYKFGYAIAAYVAWLTDPEYIHPSIKSSNRAERKRLAREILRESPDQVKTIKLADMIHNTKSIEEHDPKFWKVYREEKRLLLPCLVGGNETLWNRAANQVQL